MPSDCTQNVRKYHLTCDLDCFARDFFNALTQEKLMVTKQPRNRTFVFTVEKEMKAAVKIVPCKYEIVVSGEGADCILQFKNLDDEPVFIKYVKAYFVLGFFKIFSIQEELHEVSRFPDYIDTVVNKMLNKLRKKI